MQKNNAEAGADSGNEIARDEAERADRSFQSRTENIKRVYIKEQMERTVVKKEGSEEPPILAGGEKVRRLELAQPMEREWIG